VERFDGLVQSRQELRCCCSKADNLCIGPHLWKGGNHRILEIVRSLEPMLSFLNLSLTMQSLLESQLESFGFIRGQPRKFSAELETTATGPHLTFHLFGRRPLVVRQIVEELVEIP
jgi:hypothetical protein